MRVMSRNFTRAEKILLVVLAVLLIALVYYRFVYVNINKSITSSNAEKQSIQTDLTVAQEKVALYQGMQDELDDVMGTDRASRIESYNNSKAETSFLSSILQSTKNYSIAFSDVTRNGDLIRRSFTLQYSCNNYREAENIMSRLSQSQYRCLMTDVDCTIDSKGMTTIELVATFYETMVGGTPDSGLPKDEEETQEKVDLYNQEFNY